MADDQFDQAQSGASTTYPMQCSALRKNGHVVIKGHPCKISEMSTSKTGKHGHAKVHLVGNDIFTNKKYEDICPSTHNMDVPHVIRKDYMLLRLDEEGFFELMHDNGETFCDLKVEDVLGMSMADVQSMVDKGEDDGSTVLATVQEAMDQRCVISLRLSKK